jgi:hypothetical protein
MTLALVNDMLAAMGDINSGYEGKRRPPGFSSN